MKDLDFDHAAVIVREGKGGKDRLVMLPQSLVHGLRLHAVTAAGITKPATPHTLAARASA